LPRTSQAASVEIPTPSAQPTIQAASGRRGYILLVDDDVDVRSITAAMLDEAGYDIIEVSSGAAALDALERAGGQPELVLADIAMPGINGVEFAAIVRRTWPTLPVLLMTGYADSGLLRKNAEHEVLRKPFQATELEASLHRAIIRVRGAASHGDPPARQQTALP
jgi:CheY-like chemotaxis protein